MFRPSRIVAIALALSGPALRAQEPRAAAEPSAPNDPRLEAAYVKLVDFLRKTPAYSVEVRVDWATEGQPDGESGTNLYLYRLERPNRFRIEVRPGQQPEPALIVVSDGTTVTTLYTPKGLYSRDRVREPREVLERNPIVASSLSGSLIDTLMRPDIVEIVRSHASEARFVGLEEVDGRKLEHFRLRWRRDDEELWTGPEAEPLPRKMIRTVSVPVREGAVLKVVTTATLSWTIAGPIPAASFAIKLPEGARMVDDIYGALVRGDTATLAGKAAPELDLKRLGEGDARVRLAALKGKKVAVLAFWAGWCAPCLELKPSLDGIAGDYRDKDVSFFAINVGETPEEVAAYVKAHPSPLATVLDPDSKGAGAYGVTSIPALVVVGKDGTIQFVRTGRGEDFEPAVRGAIDALLEGKTLAAPPVPKGESVR
jgi:thiol-disulfide isomerase/thioredoxin